MGCVEIPVPDPTIRRIQLSSGKAVGICCIAAELLKAVGEPMARGLQAVLAAIWQSGTIPPDLLRGVVIPLWRRKRIDGTEASTETLHS